MLFRNEPTQYPSLVEYLNVTKKELRSKISAAMVTAVVVTGIGLVSFEALAESPIARNLYVLAVIGVWAYALMKRPAPLTPAETLKAEAAEVSKLMSECIQRSRLHRDLGDPVMTVLEDCARHWAEVHHALDTPRWRSPELPGHYQAVRDQVLSAADSAMHETVLLFRNVLPENPRQTDVKGYVGEVIQQAVFGKTMQSANLPAGFDQARAMADKLRELAAQVASVTVRAEGAMGQGQEMTASGALDLCIGELKNIQQAETELRQNLGG